MVFDSGTGNFFPDAVFDDGNPDQKNCGSVFSSMDWDVRRNFTVRGSGRIRNEGSILCVAGLFPQFLLCSGSSCAFALLLELSTESVEQAKTFFVCGLFLIGIFQNPVLIRG